ncbi:MAG: primosomal protein N', partial [Proteobacteria bacterium]|nr:primosomal protein N' [Pseudomonadota bacterium]
AQKYSATLLEGVTGSGKTEVYFEAVAQALRQGRESLVLVPEIALTSQWLERFERRFGVRPAEWHSDLGRRERRRVWRAVAEGGAPVVIGARSALFLPFANLGLIVVDEEHDSSFKQEEGVIYNARDMAVVRARDAGAAIALVSATPSLETVVNADTGRFGRVMLPDRHGGAELPRVELLDMRADPPAANHWLSPVLEREIVRTLESGKQSLLFLNRRGYAPLTLCRACGHRLECPNCQAWLVEHRHIRRLQCHHCDHTSPLPTVCPACGAEDKLAACGPGVERLAEEVRALVPTARLVVMASDTIPGPREAAELLRRVRDHEVDILIGTQVVAKGHHFPLLTLVGVVDADLGLAGGDLRAAERTYQLLWQVAGRAGREAHAGQVYLQTYMPDHEVMQGLASGDRGRFLESEQESRRLQGMPPFGRLAALIVSGEDDRAVRVAAQALGQSAPRGEKVQVLGPAPAPFALLRGRHRQRLLLKAGRGVNVQTLLRQWIAATTLPRRVRVQIDVDPYSFM